MNKYTDNILITEVIIKKINTELGIYRIEVSGEIGGDSTVIESQIRESVDRAIELAKTYAIQFGLSEIRSINF